MPFPGYCCSYKDSCSAARAHDVLLLYVTLAWARMCMRATARLSVRGSLPFLFLPRQCWGCKQLVECGGVRYLSSLSAAFHS